MNPIPWPDGAAVLTALRDGDRARGRLLLQELSSEFPGNHLYTNELARLR